MYLLKFTAGPRSIEPARLVSSGIKLYSLVKWEQIASGGVTYRSFMRRLPKAGGAWNYTVTVEGVRHSFRIERPERV